MSHAGPGGLALGLTGNVVFAGTVGGAVSAGTTEALTPGSTTASIEQKAAVGAVVGAATGVAGKLVPSSVKGAAAKIVQSGKIGQTAAKIGQALSNNGKMSNMTAGKLAAGQIRDVSERTAAKMIGGSVVSGAAPASVSAAACTLSKGC